MVGFTLKTLNYEGTNYNQNTGYYLYLSNGLLYGVNKSETAYAGRALHTVNTVITYVNSALSLSHIPIYIYRHTYETYVYIYIFTVVSGMKRREPSLSMKTESLLVWPILE